MANVECLREAVRMLVAERLALRERNAGQDGLESNWLELAGRQWQLSYAHIERFVSRAERNAA
jgi:hypothetical protein